MRSTGPLAILGAKPLFSALKPAGQLNFPAWQDYEVAFREIFARQWYTNHGPLAVRLENELAAALGVGHVIGVTTAGLGLCIATEALGIQGQVIVPALIPAATLQALRWSNVEPLYCDVDPDTLHIDLDAAERLLQQGAGGVLGVNLWGAMADAAGLEDLAGKYNVPLFFDSFSGFGCALSGRPVGSFGHAEVISMHADELLNATEGGFVTTRDDQLAERMRNVRSSYGARSPVQVARTANGRLSEAQAAVALMALHDVDVYVERNRELHDTYRDAIAGVPGIRLLGHREDCRSNYSWAVCAVDSQSFGLDANELRQVLRMEFVDARPAAALEPSGTATLAGSTNEGEIFYGRGVGKTVQTLLRLPLGSAVSRDDVRAICGRISDTHASAGQVQKILRKNV